MGAINIEDFNNHTIKEEDIIRRILAGEKELYEILVRRNNQKLYRVVRGYLKSESEIEDVMQNSYIKAYNKLHQFKLESQFSTWLIRIGINEALMELKRKGKLMYSENLHLNTDDDLVLEIPDHRQLNPQEKMVQKEATQFLENAIDRLELKYRMVYVLREVEELSLTEIAAALDISLSNAKIRLHRSKEMLKESLFELSNTKNVFEFGFNRCDSITDRVMTKIN